MVSEPPGRPPAAGEPGHGRLPGSGPLIRITRGLPDAEELAAVLAVLSVLAARRRGGRADAAAGAAPPGPAACDAGPARRSAWLDRAALLRAPLIPGPGAWRRGALPR